MRVIIAMKTEKTYLSLQFKTMKTTINNNLRVYQILDSNGRQFFCNIEDITRIVKEYDMHPGYFKIYHFWNNKARKVSKKDLKFLLLTH